MSEHNRMHNCTNPYQGKARKVLCVCSAGLLRSPTAAVVLAQEPWNFNTRSAGLREYALIPVDKILLHWADDIVCMEKWMVQELVTMTPKIITCLDIPDNYEYMQPELVALIRERFASR